MPTFQERIILFQQLIELRLAEGLEELSQKLNDIISELYKDDLVGIYLFYLLPSLLSFDCCSKITKDLQKLFAKVEFY